MEIPDDCEIAEKWNKALTKVITKRVEEVRLLNKSGVHQM